ncbi:hypothetical protein Q8A67_020024 [Cirrhinus molitorella]|uniref:Uncharacterized protein n=1 Tax=Cirrhinus molitorella TaxID=172907 RepID=A0AA88PBR8_9TELE|nr:hypothetical protein Q8A67_020024 [Cirrhinus molitorella]
MRAQRQFLFFFEKLPANRSRGHKRCALLVVCAPVNHKVRALSSRTHFERERDAADPSCTSDGPLIAPMMNARRVSPPRAVPDSRRDPRDNCQLNLGV